MSLVITTLFSRRGLLAWTVLAMGLLLVILVWSGMRDERERSANAQFKLHTREVIASIEKRLLDHEQILLGGAGLFDSTEKVTRKQWKTYIDRLQLKHNYPGIQGVGFSQVIPPSGLDAHIDAIRAEGFADYTVKPAGVRPFYTAIVYLEPFADRNLAAFGYDMFSQPTRQRAMRMAVTRDMPTITGKVELVQETHGKKQAGFLMYVPVYASGLPLKTIEERWQALRGYVYSPYRVDDLMHGILGESNLLIDFTLHDGDIATPDTLMYDSSEHHADRDKAGALYTATRQIEGYGHKWTINLRSRPAFEGKLASPLDWLIPVLGTGISLSLFALTLVLLSRREQAMALANEMMAKREESEQRFHQLFLHMGQGVLIHQHDGRILDANPAAETILGASLDQLRDLTPTDPRWRTIHEDGREFPANEHPVIVALREGKTLTGIVTGIWRPDEQRWHWLSVDAYPQIGTTHGLEKRVYSVLTDITERKRVESMKSEFVSTVSHELRTPLTSISGALGLVASGTLGALPNQANEMIALARKNCNRLTFLINDLLDMEKLAAGKMHFDMQPQKIMPLVVHSLDTNRAYGVERQITLELTGTSPDVEVRVDGQRLMQVMSNLLSNAIKFSPEGEPVTVSVTADDHSVRVSVADHGPGIPDEFRDRIFQKFAQADASDTREKGGTGLGLAITRELVERMDGSIGFESAEGGGARFFFDLPIWHSQVDSHGISP